MKLPVCPRCCRPSVMRTFDEATRRPFCACCGDWIFHVRGALALAAMDPSQLHIISSAFEYRVVLLQYRAEERHKRGCAPDEHDLCATAHGEWTGRDAWRDDLIAAKLLYAGETPQLTDLGHAVLRRWLHDEMPSSPRQEEEVVDDAR